MKKKIVILLSLSVFLLIFIFNVCWEYKKGIDWQEAHIKYLSEHSVFYYRPAGDDNWLQRIFEGKNVTCDRWEEGILKYDSILFYHDFALDFDVIIPDSMVRYINNPDKEVLLFTSETDVGRIVMFVTCLRTKVGKNLQERCAYYMNSWKEQIHIISDEEKIEQDCIYLTGTAINMEDSLTRFQFIRKFVNRDWDYDLSLFVFYDTLSEKGKKEIERVVETFPDRPF